MGLSGAIRERCIAGIAAGPPASTDRRTSVVFRVSAARRPAVVRHLLALDADDRYLRFGHAAADGVVASYAASIDFSRDVVLAVGDAGGGFLVGVAHVALAAPHAEFGLSVLPQWRRRGIGRILFVETMRVAAAGGMRAVDCVTGNPFVLNMARAEGFVIYLSAGEPRATLHFPSG
jgi:GNAT superfamily N-acetyltransferase